MNARVEVGSTPNATVTIAALQTPIDDLRVGKVTLTLESLASVKNIKTITRI